MSAFLEVLGTGVFAGLVVQAIQIYRDRSNERRAVGKGARIQAFALSNSLMSYKMKCDFALSSADEVEELAHGEFVPAPATIPVQNFLSLAEGLSNLDLVILGRIADLEFQKEFEEDYIKVGWTYWMDMDDVAAIQKKRLQFLVREADDLAQTVRAKYGLPAFGDPARLLTAFESKSA